MTMGSNSHTAVKSDAALNPSYLAAALEIIDVGIARGKLK